MIPDRAAPRLLLLDARSWTLRAALALPGIATAVRVDGDEIEIATAAGVVRLRGGDPPLD